MCFIKRRQSQKGFTIIELMVVLFIISVLLLTFTQLIGNLQKRLFLTTNRLDLNAYLKLSRDKAVVSGKTHVLIVDHEAKKIGLKALPAEFANKPLDISMVGSSDGEDLLPGAWVLKQIPLPFDLKAIFSLSGQELKGHYTYVFFYADGSSDSLLWQTEKGGIFLSSQPANSFALSKEFFEELSFP